MSANELLVHSTDRTIRITVFARTTTAPRPAFAIIAPIDLADVFHPVGPFPGVETVEGLVGSWDRPGSYRHPQFTDGSTATEKLTEYVEGSGFAYELTDFTNVLAQLALGVRGEMSFLPDGAGATIRWTYEFKPRAGRRWILAGPFKPFWSHYMQVALDRMVAAAERPSAIMTE